MNTHYNQPFAQGTQAVPIAGTLSADNLPATWQAPVSFLPVAKPGKIEKKVLQVMDHFFTILLLISGEEEYETISIGHIL